MQSLSGYFFSDYRYTSHTLWFRRFLYTFLIFESLYFLAAYDLFFGVNSIVYKTPQYIGFFKSIPYLLYNSQNPALGWYFLFGILLLSALNLASTRFAFISDVLLWLLALNISNQIYPALTGGDNLLNQFLFFNCFLSAAFKRSQTSWSEFRICIHNLAVVGIVIQICLVYFLSALAKLQDPSWLSGEAIAQVTQIRHFSLFSFFNYSENLKWLFVCLNYLVLAYQLLFPVLIWVKKTKKVFLILGVLMHLYIAFFMGLVGFGFIMVLAYVYFWPMKKSS